MSQYDDERRKWDDDQVKKDWRMWREITGGGRPPSPEQQERYEATRREMERRKFIPVER